MNRVIISVPAGALILAGALAGCGGRGHPAPAPGHPAVASSRTASPTASPFRNAAPPVLYTCNGKSVTRPRSYLLACGDGTASLEKLKWASWTTAHAATTGQLSVNDCTPDCAQGTFHNTDVHVILSAPHGAAAPYYTRMSMTGGCGHDCGPIELGRDGTAAPPPTSPPPPASSPPQPGPVSTQATLTSTCTVGWIPEPQDWVPLVGITPGTPFYSVSAKGTGSPLPSGDKVVGAYQVTLTDTSAYTANVTGFAVVFYSGGTETGSDEEQANGFITPHQSLTWTEAPANPPFMTGTQGAIDSSATCQVVGWTHP